MGRSKIPCIVAIEFLGELFLGVCTYPRLYLNTTNLTVQKNGMNGFNDGLTSFKKERNIFEIIGVGIFEFVKFLSVVELN